MSKRQIIIEQKKRTQGILFKSMIICVVWLLYLTKLDKFFTLIKFKIKQTIKTGEPKSHRIKHS